MLRFLCIAFAVACLLLAAGGPDAVGATSAGMNETGLTSPFIGAGRGDWSTSVGVFFHENGDVTFRNFQLRADVDLLPGVRLHSVVRSNRELDRVGGWNPRLDEGYLEGFAFQKSESGTISTSLRIGNIRYLHFLYPDSIAMFDTVPTTLDIREGAKEAVSYSGSLLTIDYAHKSGFGLHATGIKWGFERNGGSQVLEDYAFFRQNIGVLHFEGRYGGLQTRQQPLGRRENGFNFYFGSLSNGMTIGLLYEKLEHQAAYTGIMVTFPMDKVTKALGSIAFDWDRRPSGFAMQVPLVSGKFGGIRNKAPENAILVGEVKVERLRTYCSNGQVRNYYEHRLSNWGETASSDLIVVLKEEPWYLQAEAVVSPHTFAVGFDVWDKDRTGPAQISQKATYKFYRTK